MASDFSYLKEESETILRILATDLNAIHGLNEALEYWRKIVGYYLIHVVPVVYDRYSQILQLTKAFQLESLRLVPEFPGYEPVCASMTNFLREIDAHPFNEWVFTKCFKFVLSYPGRLDAPQVQKSEPPVLTRANEKTLSEGRPRLDFIPQQIALFSSQFGRIDMLKNFGKTWMIPKILQFQQTEDPKVFEKQSFRKKIGFGQDQPPFVQLCLDIISETIPANYIEYFGIRRDEARRKTSRRIRTILTSNGFAQDDFNIFVAEQKKSYETRYIIAQHGGNYGIGKFNASEDFESDCADVFLTWGWSRHVKQKPSFSPLIYKKSKSYNRNKGNGLITALLCCLPVYSYWMWPAPQAGRFQRYIDDLAAFGNNLSPDSMKKLNLKWYGYDFGWNVEKQVRDATPYSRQNMNLSWEETVNNSEVVVSTYNATSFLETLALNIPTVIFWDPTLWEISSEVMPFFSIFKELGLYHENPLSAALHLNKIEKNVQDWWNTSEIQTIIKEFCCIYARSDSVGKSRFLQSMTSQ